MDGLLAALALPLTELIVTLEATLSVQEDQASTTMDIDTFDTVHAKLEALLADDDAEAANLLDENAELLQAVFPNHYRKLADAIGAFDFETALAVLRDAAAISS